MTSLKTYNIIIKLKIFNETLENDSQYQQRFNK